MRRKMMNHRELDMEELTHLLKLTDHTEVVEYILYNTNVNNYTIVHEELYSYIVPKKVEEENRIVPMLCVHTDTVASKKPKTFEINGDVITNPDGVLGADDRAGCYIVKKLLENDVQDFVIGVFDLEEIGGLGSNEFCKDSEAGFMVDDYVSCFVGLDRRGGSDIALYGCDSPAFLTQLDNLKSLGYEEAFGSFTDASNLAGAFDLCCCNLSVGYYNEHTQKESLNVKEMMNTYDVLLTGFLSPLEGAKYESEGYDYYRDLYETPSYVEPNGYSSAFKPIECDDCGSRNYLNYDGFGGYLCDDCLEIEKDYETKGW